MCNYAFRIVGSVAGGKRRLVLADACLSAYASCDPRCDLDNQSYLSAFYYGDDFRTYLEANGTPRGYNGACWSPFLWFDIDREGNLDQARTDTQKLCRYCQAEYGLTDLILFFSGGKGFHVGVPLNAPASPNFNKTARQVAEHIGGCAGVQIDPAIYSKVQPFRCPNSKHPKTGLHKRHLTDSELSLPVEKIIDLAKNPVPFTLPKGNDLLRGVWQQVERTARAGGLQSTTLEHKPEVARLNRGTLDFIKHGATDGNRHRLLFSASANLTECGCPPDLAFALLTDAGLDSGLPTAEVRRQITCGLRRGANG